MSNGRKLGFSGLTSLSLDSFEAGVGSMTDSRPFGYYSYFFRMFRTLVFEANVRLGGEWYDASPSKSSFVSRGSTFLRFLERGPAVEPVPGLDSGLSRGTSLSGVFVSASYRYES